MDQLPAGAVPGPLDPQGDVRSVRASRSSVGSLVSSSCSRCTRPASAWYAAGRSGGVGNSFARSPVRPAWSLRTCRQTKKPWASRSTPCFSSSS
ncbi:hypothetical protein ACFQZ4_43450 [Catellatospora coxensis]